MSFPDNEPAITAGSVSALVAAVIALLVAFGVPLTDQQREAILGLVAVVAPLAVALLVRPHVVPEAKVAATIEDVARGNIVAPAPPPVPPSAVS